MCHYSLSMDLLFHNFQKKYAFSAEISDFVITFGVEKRKYKTIGAQIRHVSIFRG